MWENYEKRLKKAKNNKINQNCLNINLQLTATLNGLQLNPS